MRKSKSENLVPSKIKSKAFALILIAIFIVMPISLFANPFAAIPQREVDGTQFVPIRLAADAHGFEVAWDSYHQAVVVTDPYHNAHTITISEHGVFNDNGTVYMPLTHAVEIFSPNPLIGTWVWVADNNFTYIFNPDGTGERGFAGLPVETFTWRARGMTLNINRTDQIPTDVVRYERWSFAIAHDTLTIVSRQFAGRVFSFERGEKVVSYYDLNFEIEVD